MFGHFGVVVKCVPEMNLTRLRVQTTESAKIYKVENSYDKIVNYNMIRL